MASYLWVFLAVVNEVTATFRPRQLSPCQVVKSDVFCSSMNLKTIPMELPPHISKLDLSHNLLQNVTQELSTFYNSIRHLNLHSNRIEFIQPGLFKDMRNLEVLDLSSNNLDIFALSQSEIGSISTVTNLDLSGNGLYTDMPFYFLQNAPALQNLSLEGNSLTKIDNNTFAGSLALRSIDLHNNAIMDIEEGTFESLKDLSELNLSKNSITCIIDFNLSQLTLLNLSQNSIESFQTTPSDLEYELLYLDLRQNKIYYFPVLPRKNKLMHLDVSRNLMQSVFDASFAGDLEYSSFRDNTWTLNRTLSVDKNTFNSLPKLMYLDMSYNEIRSIPASFFSSMGSLEYLNLSNNCLQDFSLDNDSPLNSLETLDLNFNALLNLSFGENTLRSLKRLYLKGNALHVLAPNTFLRLPSIEVLDLQQNNISICSRSHRKSQQGHRAQETGCVTFSSMPTLRYLYLASNGLVSLPQYSFYGSPLLVLDLSDNPGLEIHKKAFSGLESSLTYVSLRGNDLQTLNIDLSPLTRVKNMDLSANRLKGLPPLGKESSIEFLNLQSNSLLTLEYSTVLALERSLKTLYLGGNPLICCSSPRLLHLIQQSTVNIPDRDIVTCRYSQNLEYKEVNISSVLQEHCQEKEGNSAFIITIIITALVLIAVLIFLSKYCHQRRHRFSGSFKA